MSNKKFPAKSEDNIGDESAQDQIEAKRRKAVRRIVASAGVVATMSGNWKKPVLSSVVLPAHAIGTCPETDGASDDEIDCV